MKTKGWVYLGLVGLVGCASDVGTGSDEPVEETEQRFFYASGALWSDTDISVCWTTGNSVLDGTERGWVRDVVEATFEPVTQLDFTGWGTCGPDGADIAIQQNATNWPSSEVGSRPPSATPSMWLNHFNGEPRDLGDGPEVEWPACWTGDPTGMNPRTGVTGRQWDSNHRWCVEATAVHEFFHALGVDHEQNSRNGAPSWCARDEDPEGNPIIYGDTQFGYWDLTSTSNYCNPASENDGYLSQLDTAGLNFFYGWNTNDRVWYGIGNVRDYGNKDWDQLLFAQESMEHTGTYEIAVGNFDGDGEDDVLMYREGSGNDYVQYGRSIRGWDQVTHSVTGTYDPVTGDFDGDGEDDIFWYAPGSAADKLWFGKSNRSFDNTTPANITGTYTKVMSGDFDGDGRSDLFLYAAGSTADKVWFGRSDRTFDTVTPSNVNSTYEPFTGNFDGDSEDDVFWYRPGESSDSIWFGNSNRTFSSVSVTVNGTYTPTAGDFDGDGTSDVLWNKAGAEDPVWLHTGSRGEHVTTRISSIIGDAFTLVESAPYAGDFDGDDLADVFWYKSN